METFYFAFTADTSSQSTARSRLIQFGDGYTQRSNGDLNKKAEEYTIECPGMTLAVKNDLDAFLDRHGGHKAFLWTPPEKPQAKFIVVQPVTEAQKRGGGSIPYFYTRSFKLRRVYDL
jgi:phage-related protein